MTGAAPATVADITANRPNLPTPMTATEMLRRLEWLPPDTDEDGKPVPPLQLPHEPEHVANLVVFLASEASDHLTGELIPIRGLMEFDR